VIKVLIVEDNAVVRAGLSQLLESEADIKVVAMATDGAEAVELAAAHHPDVILMDLSMPGTDGIEATRRIHEQDPESQIVILTSFSDRDRILEALDAGAIGYLLKDAEPDELFRGVRAAVAGGSPLAPKVARTMLGERDRSNPAAALSDREREVMALLGDGLANKQIARRLEISEKTVKSHLTNIYRQINVASRTEAVVWAREHGLTGTQT
jgi:DNA-binding NarL/FixJ family response regulator